ncbi:dipeptidase 2 isoform X2 [Alosa pseudoharengus]|uniref:dipeptidase 2 isoform X2 n=1 Tax=Alosa pseudoharengus TaxID=34774 RepID=UPI003F88B23E
MRLSQRYSGKLTEMLPHTVWIFLAWCVLLVQCDVNSGSSLGKQTVDLMLKYPLIDGHNDLALQLRIRHKNKLSQIDPYKIPQVATDINRLKTGYVGALVFAAYVMCTAQDKDAVRLALEQIDVILRLCSEWPDFEMVNSSEGLRNTKKMACILSLEGGHIVDSSLPALRMFYRLGVRSMALTHTCNTPWAESSSNLYTMYKKKNSSLSEFGKAVVDEMNRLGMIVDLSHSSWATAWAVLNVSKAPVIFSHSSAFAMCSHHRNIPDNLLDALKDNKGLIMVNFYSEFVGCGPKANISIVADHFDHIKSQIGADSIGIGGDFDGASNFPEGLEDVSKYPSLIQELLRRNWTEAELAGVLRLNFIRVFEDVERVRDTLKGTHPSEMEIPLKEVDGACRLDLRPPTPTKKSIRLATVKSESNFLSGGALIWMLLLICLLLQ